MSDKDLSRDAPSAIGGDAIVSEVRTAREAPCSASSRNADLDEVFCRTSCHGIRNGIGRRTDSRPARCAQYDDRDAPRGQILLILQVLVGGDHHFKSGVLSCLQQCSVSQRRPPALVGGLYGMQREPTTERRRSALIEQDTHLRCAETTTSRVLQDCTYLLDGDAWEPFDEVASRCIVLEILEEGSDWHASTAEHPRSAVPFRVSLNRLAGGPVHHA